MTQICILEKSHQRIAPELARRGLEVEVVTWSPESDGGGFALNGQPVEPDDIAPVAGWISTDVFAAKCIREYGQSLLQFPSMGWLQTANAGLDNPIYKDLAAQNVRITKSGSQAIPIAEFVLAHALAHYQQIDLRRTAQAEKRWQPHRFRELWHSHWLIIGYGHIGAGVAQRARGFDAEVTIVRQRQGDVPHADRVIPLSDVAQYLPDADFVVLACPATEETTGLANAQFFAKMKAGSMLLNIARGSLVDEAALLEGLDRGAPEHAVLDVFQTEPLPQESPLWSHPGVTVAAHTSNAGDGTRPRGDTLFLDNLEKFLAGEPLYDEVDLSGLR